MPVDSLPCCVWYRVCYMTFNYESMFWWHFIASYIWVCCLYMFLKNCYLDGILFFVCWTCVTCISLERRERCLHCMKLKRLIPIRKNSYICLPSNSGGSSRPLVPSTLVFILIWSSLVKSPLHILFSIWPYSGSSLKQCWLSKMITALMQFSQCWLDKLENRSSVSLAPTGSSWQKSPANIIVNPPKG